MNRKVRVALTVEMTEEQFADFLQHIRDFDMKYNAEIEFEIHSSCPEMKSEDMLAIFDKIKPPFPFSFSALAKNNWELKELPEKKGN